MIFTLLTLIHIPVMYQYSNYSVIAGNEQDQPAASNYTFSRPENAFKFELFNTQGLGSYSLGNLGQSSTKCQSVRLIANSLKLGCQTGTITDITDWGVYEGNSEADVQNLCTSKT